MFSRGSSFWVMLLIACISVDALAVAGSASYIYDNQGRVMQVQYPNSAQLLYAYDTEGNRQFANIFAVLVDTDLDGVADSNDNCPLFLNANQLNTDDDLQGDMCDVDHNADGDGLLDAWEVANFGNLTTSNGAGDSDSDGLSDLQEYLASTDPLTPFHAVADNVVMQQTQVVDIPLDALLVNEFNPLLRVLAVTGVAKTGTGTPDLLSPNVRFTPLGSQVGADAFMYTISGDAKTDSDQVNVTITPTGQPIVGTSSNEILFGAANGSTVDPAGGDDIIYGKTGGVDKIALGKNEGNDILFINDNLFEDAIDFKTNVAPADVSFEYHGSDLWLGLNGSTGSFVIADVKNDPTAYSVKKLTYSSAGHVGDVQTFFAVNDYFIAPAPAVLTDNFSFVPAAILANDIGFGLAPYGVVNTTTMTATNVSYGPVYNPGCWGSDCFEFQVNNYALPVNFSYDFMDGGVVPGHATARFTLITDGNFIGTDKDERITGRDDEVDVLEGMGGDDYVEGGSNSADTIKFGLGDGQDTVWLLDWSAPGDTLADKVVLKTGLGFSGVHFQRVGLDLVIGVNGSGDQLSFQWFFANSALANLLPFDRVQFADVSHADMLRADIVAAASTYGATLVGTSGNDLYTGTGAGMTATSPDLIGTTGDDVIFGMAGNDRLWGDAGNDTLYGGDGADTLSAGGGNDQLYGDDDDDWFWGGGASVLYWGGAGKDTYGIAPTYGQITINNLDATTPDASCLPSCITTKDAAWFVSGVTDTQVTFSRAGDDLVFKTTDGTNTSTSTIIGYIGNAVTELDFRFTNAVNGSNGAINPVIWDGSCVDYDVTDANDDSLESLKLLVDSNDDGAPDNARLDYNTARTGAEAGCMYNRLVRDMSTTGDDVIVGLSGNDWINGRAGNDNISGGYGDDVIYGGAGSDTLDGGLGSRDYLSGGEGGDTYVIHPDSYEETISDKDTTVSGTETDGVNFVEGTTANQLWFYLDDTDVDGTVDDLVIQNIASGTKVMIENWTSTANQIENIGTQSGACSALSYSAISGLLTIMPSKATPPTVNFLDAVLAPYWNGTGC